MSAQERGLSVVQPGTLVTGYAGPPAIDWREVERIVNENLWRGLSAAERQILWAWSKQFDLNPLAMEVVSISGRPFVTLAGLLKVAERSGKYDGATAESVSVMRLVDDGRGNVREVEKYVATATVWHRDRSHPVIMQARQWEHENPKSTPWQKSPAAMTEKCALARALRLSFSLTGLTAAEEVGYDEESSETNAGRVAVLISPGEAGLARARAKEAESDSGAGGQLAAGVSGAGAGDDDGEGVPNDLTWNELWPFFRARGLSSRKEVNEALGRDTSQMTPAHIKRAWLKAASEPEPRPGDTPARVTLATPLDPDVAPVTPSDLGWTDFWAWARARGLGDRKALDQALGKSTSGMTPKEIADALLLKEAEAHAPKPEPTPEEKANRLLDWLGEKERPRAKQREALAKLFALAADGETLVAYHATALQLTHQDDADAAYQSRVAALGLMVPTEEPVAEGEFTDEELADVPF